MLSDRHSSWPSRATRVLCVMAVAALLVACPGPEVPPGEGAVPEAVLTPVDPTPGATPTVEIEEPAETPAPDTPVPDTPVPDTPVPPEETPEATPEMTPEATPEATPEVDATPEAEAEAETAGQLASAGQEVYMERCAQCHGEEGQGVTAPALIGERANLRAYATAHGLFNYTRRTMPLDAPGSLSRQEYLEVTAFMLLENEYVEEDDPLSEEELEEIQLQ
jgi:S-disulfanyl-L-cysteine oxidoreductase SoxD